MQKLSSSLLVFLRTYGKAFSLLLMMLLGMLLPQLHILSFLIQYLLMVMLFFAFLDMEISFNAFTKNVILVLLANLGVAFLGYVLLMKFDTTLALVAFVTGIAPTAIASPVITGFINKRVDVVAAAVLLTNVASALVIPLSLPLVAGMTVHISTWDILWQVAMVMILPLLLARLCLSLPIKVLAVVRSGKRSSFALWLINLLLMSAKTAEFIYNESSIPVTKLGGIALVALVVCVVNFGLGAWLGGKELRQETSQALGQKNNSFIIWLSLTFINPLVAMGPAFYILYHNMYNSYQIYQFEKKRRDAG